MGEGDGLAEGIFVLLILVGGFLVWYFHDKAKTNDRKSQLVSSLKSEKQYTLGRPAELGDPYALPLLMPGHNFWEAPRDPVILIETWWYSDQDEEDPERVVDGRFPLWAFAVREPDNTHDDQAVAVYALDYWNPESERNPGPFRGNRRIGYLPPASASSLSSIMRKYDPIRVPMRIHYGIGYKTMYLVATPETLETQLKETGHPIRGEVEG